MNTTKNGRVLAAFLALGVLALTAAGCSTGHAESGAGAASEVAATIGDRNITISEVDAKVAETDPKAYQAMYDARRLALDTLINDDLFEAEASKKGVTVNELRQEVARAIPTVTDEDVQAFFQEKQAQMGGRTFDQVAGQIRTFLTNQSAQNGLKDYMRDLRTAAGVDVLIDAPRTEVAVSAEDPAKGPNDAPITIVEFSDFQCPYCSRVNPTIDQLKDVYGDKIRVVFRDFPLSFHAQAQGAAEAAQCANDQDRFWDYHDKLFASQQALQTEDLKKYAGELGLDEAKFNGCLDSGVHREEVLTDMREGQVAGVTGTPAFFVNGRFLNGAQPFEAFARVIDEELETAGIQ